MTKLLVALLFVGLNYYTYAHLATDEEAVPPRQSFESFPLEIGDWQCRGNERMPEEVLANLGVTDYLICNYVSEPADAIVNVYVGYHETQVRKEGGGGQNSIHPPEHCLPGAGWDVIDARLVPLQLEGMPTSDDGPALVKRFVIAKGEARQLVYFWYQSRGRVLARNHEVIIYKFWDRASRNRTDGSLVRFTVPILRENEDLAEATFRDFAAALTPLLPDYIPN